MARSANVTSSRSRCRGGSTGAGAGSAKRRSANRSWRCARGVDRAARTVRGSGPCGACHLRTWRLPELELTRMTPAQLAHRTSPPRARREAAPPPIAPRALISDRSRSRNPDEAAQAQSVTYRYLSWIGAQNHATGQNILSRIGHHDLETAAAASSLPSQWPLYVLRTDLAQTRTRTRVMRATARPASNPRTASCRVARPSEVRRPGRFADLSPGRDGPTARPRDPAPPRHERRGSVTGSGAGQGCA